MAHTQLSSNDSGFTIMEVLIALAIFSIGLMAVGALQANSLMETGDVAQKTEAWTFADEQAELLKQLPFYNEIYPAAPATHPPALVLGGFAAHTLNVPVGNPRYTVHWQVEDNLPFGPVNVPAAAPFKNVPAGTYTVCKRITLRVTRLGATRSPMNWQRCNS
jgi:prepilin-type N-terminal cleavage/methylation domain-containing protein